jgi:hypothetical protein
MRTLLDGDADRGGARSRCISGAGAEGEGAMSTDVVDAEGTTEPWMGGEGEGKKRMHANGGGALTYT